MGCIVPRERHAPEPHAQESSRDDGDQGIERYAPAALAAELSDALEAQGWRLHDAGKEVQTRVAADAIVGFLLEHPTLLAQALAQSGHSLVVLEVLSHRVDESVWRAMREEIPRSWIRRERRAG